MASIAKFDEWQNTAGIRQLTIVQTVQTLYTDTFSTTGSSGFVNFTGLDTTITPKLANSRFFICYNIMLGYADSASRRVVLKINGSYYNTRTTDNFRASGLSFYLHNAASNLSDATILAHQSQFIFQNSGTTNLAISFELYKQSTGIMYVNRSSTYDDDARGRPLSSLIVMEIG